MKISSALGRTIGRLGVVSHCLMAAFLFAAPTSQLSAQEYRISTGDDYGAVIDAEGNLFVWGAITGGSGVLQQIPGTWREVSVSRTPAANAHILLIASDGSLWSFGNNDRGQLGAGDQISREEPVQISPASTWAEVAAGAQHSLARDNLGRVFAWGDNSFAQLNRPAISNNPEQDFIASVPANPIDPNVYISIATGNAHNHAIRADGTLWAWGSGGSETNSGPELGILVDGSYPKGPVFLTQVGNGTNWTKLFGGYRATFALRDTSSESGQLWVWGTGGNLGGSDSIIETPRRVGTQANWSYVSHSTSLGDGRQHALALKTDGTLYGWGSNYPDGQLGLPHYDGNGRFIFDNTRRVTPTLLEAPDVFLAVGAGDGFSALIDADGFMQTAGRNDAGQLANGSIDSTPETGQDFFDNSSLGVADLVALSVTVNTPLVDVVAGETISVSFEIQNAGTGPIAEPFDLEARLNTFGTFGGETLTFPLGLTSFEVNDDFAPGQSRSIDVEIELPGNITQGTYFIVMRADSGNAIIENSETNNDAATGTSFSFLPDLVVPEGPPNGLQITSGSVYDPADTLDIDLQIENLGNGTLPSGSTFDVRVFLSPDRSTSNSGIVEFNIEDPIVLASDLEADPSLNSTVTVPFNLVVPPMPPGSYFVGVELDINDDIAEQPELLDDNNVVVQVDGETNNAAFSDGLITISGLTIAEGVDQDGTLTFDTDGDGEWFGQNSFFNNDGDAAQSPGLDAGEWASFSTSFATPVAISFDWSANTSSQDNRLEFRVVNGTTGGNNNSISGNTDGWIENVTRVIPSGAQAEWVYFQDAGGIGDTVFVDNLQFTEITEPDLVIDDIYLPSDAGASYVLQRDRLDLTINSRNQGTSTAGEDYVISIYLSPDPVFDEPDADPLTPDDILIREEIVTEVIEGGEPAVNLTSVRLDTTIDPGFYYVIGFIDSGDTVTEFTGLVGGVPFPGEENNVFVTDTALVEIVALPDIQVDSLNTTPSFYFINDPATGYLEANSLPFNFTLSNQGLAAVNDPFLVQALFSRDQVLDPGSDYSFLEYEYSSGLGSVTSTLNTRNVSPDDADFRQNIVDAGIIGERLFFGVLADSGDAIAELYENNNSSPPINNNLILSEFTLQDALDVSDTTVSELNITFTNDQQAPYDNSYVPWVGQSSNTFDAFDAAASVRVGDSETSRFSVSLEPDVPVRVSFWWKVSSEDDPLNGQRDYLAFFETPPGDVFDLDDADRAIYGVDELEWRRVEVVLDAGSHTLTWAYVKDAQGEDGEDRGWVDQLTITELPNLEVTAVSVDGSVSYQAGETINTWSVDIANTGEAIEAGTAFDVQVRLLPSANWAETDAITLLTITDDSGIGEGESRSYNNTNIASYTTEPATAGPLTLPAADYDLEYYYFGAYVDWLEADPGSGQVSESNESIVDNSEITEEASIQIGRPDIVGSAASISFVSSGPYAYQDLVGLTLDLTNIGDGVLSGGTGFDYSVYITRTDEEADLDASSSTLLTSGTANQVTSVASGGSLDSITVLATLPYGLADGDYFIAVEIDANDDVLEQGLAPDGTGIDGEANNVFFTNSPNFAVADISLYEALEDQGGPPFAFEDGDVAVPTPPTPYITQGTESSALWFGRDDAGDATIPEDDATFTDGDGAQTPDLQAGEFAEFSLTVPESSLVRFDWQVFSASDQNELSVLVNGVEVASISGDVPLAEIDPAILVPNNGVVTWRYTKNAATVGDFGYIDNLRIDDNDDPDLVLTALNYTPGEYVLDIAGFAGAPNQLLGTEYLDITVEATNQGESITATSFTTADIEVRLSTDRIYGNDNDIVLGTVSQVEGDLLSGSLIRFIGPIQLGDSIPENSYYLIAKVDPNDQVVTEFSESNNMLISENRDVIVSRRPALRLYNPDATVTTEGSDGETNFLDPRELETIGDPNSEVVAFDVDEGLFYYPEAPMRLRFSVQNIGLDRIQADEEWTVQVNLVGALRQSLQDAQSPDPNPQAFLDFFDEVINLGDFTVKQLMEGRSAAMPEGQILDFDVELAIPSGSRFTALLPEDRVITDYLWAIQIDLDANNEIPQSSIVREFPARIIPSGLPWLILNPFEGVVGDDTDPGPAFAGSGNDLTLTNSEMDEGAFGLVPQLSTVSEASWEALYGVIADEAGTPTQVANFLAYAFNRNPNDGDTVGNQFPGSFGITEEQGEEYLSISFDFVTRASDLQYVVEADNSALFDDAPEVLLTITPPFTETVDVASLTGDGGAIYEDNVVTVLDQGYSARVTVRDSIDVTTEPMRFIRVIVESVETTGVPDSGP
ncbi:hypothetical protein DDZ13_14460 [Coraliomargarita sinensis]|uniref:CARDB domain-containing protein n=1 Tax=Coraliomargarita sinensis TaxID=2174842 RepID=A0A317ZCY6_9BACT|nr:CARDB domain-containing protein [Coraliomargarita sinensis]PXA02986.1 hypothetical protein DDZ13_14460 [Coraliomargarita sinensis]